tara:strand:+ start:1858 stop:2040 length:183 start_codon:yes stop_codon:yes gene_type:complete
MSDIQELIDDIEDLIDNIAGVMGHSLPPEYRIGDEGGDEAFAREILNKLLEVQNVIMDFR